MNNIRISFRSFTACSVALSLALLAAPTFADDSTLFEFKSAVGSQPLRAGGAVNAIAGISPGGAPWVIESLKAKINIDGSISARGKGLLLGGGDNVGTRGGPRKVLASLFCRNAPTPPAVAGTLQTSPYDSEFVDLDVNGDFKIAGKLTNSIGATPPSDCADKADNRPVLLIRTVTNGAPGAWFAAGILDD